jgi:hypothetical protein
MISAANLHLLFLDADGFYLDEFAFQSFLSQTRDDQAIRQRFMRIKERICPGEHDAGAKPMGGDAFACDPRLRSRG